MRIDGTHRLLTISNTHPIVKSTINSSNGNYGNFYVFQQPVIQPQLIWSNYGKMVFKLTSLLGLCTIMHDQQWSIDEKNELIL
jgi:hypothetical protein